MKKQRGQTGPDPSSIARLGHETRGLRRRMFAPVDGEYRLIFAERDGVVVVPDEEALRRVLYSEAK